MGFDRRRDRSLVVVLPEVFLGRPIATAPNGLADGIQDDVPLRLGRHRCLSVLGEALRCLFIAELSALKVISAPRARNRYGKQVERKGYNTALAALHQLPELAKQSQTRFGIE
jgi:hypothetical protein